MPYKYGNAPGLLQETISKITYKSEYTTSFTRERVPLQNVRIPTGLKDVYQFLGNRVRCFLVGPEYQLGPDFV